MACAVIVLADQWSKALVVGRLSLAGSLDIAPFLAFTYVENRGISFGMMQGVGNGPLLAVNLVFTAIIYFYWRRRDLAGALNNWESRGLVLILSGAIGNNIDRILRGCVIDFVDLKVWPVFNIADSAISIGVAFYLLGSLLSRRRAAKKGLKGLIVQKG